MLVSTPSSINSESTKSKGLISSTESSSDLCRARILFFAPEGDLATNGVYASQVGGLAKYCESLGATCKIWDNKFRGHHWFFQIVGYAKQLIDKNRDELVEFKPTHIYVRNAPMVIAAKKLARMTGAKLIYSMRGADVAEALLGGNIRALILAANSAFQVRRAISVADHINVVSKTMSDWIYRKYHCASSVLPCCVAEEAFVDVTCITERRNKIVVYSGGISAWQKIDSIIEMMKKMSEMDNTIRFLFLTRNIVSLEYKCSQHGFTRERWEAKACRPNEVACELAKADCGIIFRDDTIINRVASPIKVGEYLAAGLGIVASPYIGDVGADLADKEFAHLVNDGTNIKDIVEFVQGLTAAKRTGARHWAHDHLTYDGNRAAVLEMFS